VIDGQASGKTVGNVPTIDFKAHSNSVDVARLGELSPLVAEYGLNGLVQLSLTASGPNRQAGVRGRT
jgi:hypothetical protein